VSTPTASNSAKNVFTTRKIQTPEVITKAIDDLLKTWTRADGEELTEALEVATNARQLSAGFFYRWKFPRGEPQNVIDLWFERRKNWSKELRERLKDRREGLDSALLCTNAAIRFSQAYKGPLPVWESNHLQPWLDVKDSVQPETEAVWLSDFLAEDCARWANENRGIVWYEYGALGARIAKLSGLPQHAGGQGAEGRILAERGDRSLIVSIKAHGTGRDGLQRLFDHQLIANSPSSGATWEQLLGRLHRIGQQRNGTHRSLSAHQTGLRSAGRRAVTGGIH
jgi:hypothetical protein